MKNLKNIKKAPFEIGQALSANKNLVGLLIDDSDNPTETTKSFKDLLNSNYIVIYPPVNDGAIKDYDRNTYMIVLLDTINTSSDENISVTGNIYITTDFKHILLTNNRNRLLELADLVIQILEGIKLSCAGEIHVTHISHTMINEFRAGYRIGFTFSDQQARLTEI